MALNGFKDIEAGMQGAEVPVSGERHLGKEIADADVAVVERNGGAEDDGGDKTMLVELNQGIEVRMNQTEACQSEGGVGDVWDDFEPEFGRGKKRPCAPIAGWQGILVGRWRHGIQVKCSLWPLLVF